MLPNDTAQKMKFSIKDFFNKSFLRIWSDLLKKSLMENLIFCAKDFKYYESCGKYKRMLVPEKITTFIETSLILAEV